MIEQWVEETRIFHEGHNDELDPEHDWTHEGARGLQASIALKNPEVRIRATVIGASQYTVQVSLNQTYSSAHATA